MFEVILISGFVWCSSLLQDENQDTQGYNYAVINPFDSELKSLDTLDWGRPIEMADSLLQAHQNIRVFVEVKSKPDLVEVEDFTKWPDHIIRTYNLVSTEEDKPILLIDIPYSESGDWHIEYSYYFDREGNTEAIKIQRSFFNSNCVEGILKEVVWQYYNKAFKMLSKEYSLTDKQGNNVDRTDCVFNYDFESGRYREFSTTPVAYQLSKKH